MKNPPQVLGDSWDGVAKYVKENGAKIANVIATIPWGFIAFIHVTTGVTLTVIQGLALIYCFARN